MGHYGGYKLKKKLRSTKVLWIKRKKLGGRLWGNRGTNLTYLFVRKY